MSTQSASTAFDHAPTPSSQPFESRDQRSSPGQPEALSSERLLGGRREVLIRHDESVYRLRHTSNDKLILTK